MFKNAEAKTTLVVLDPELINILLSWYPDAYLATQLQVYSYSHLFQDILGLKWFAI